MNDRQITDLPGVAAGWGLGDKGGPGGPCGFVGIAAQPLIIIASVIWLALSPTYRRVYRERRRAAWAQFRSERSRRG